jgi:hypothetical protein
MLLPLTLSSSTDEAIKDYFIFGINESLNFFCFLLGDIEGDEAVELQRKLEMLNSMLDQETRAEQARKQQQYYIQCECE